MYKYSKILAIIIVVLLIYSICAVMYIIINYPVSQYFMKIQYEVRPLILLIIMYIYVKHKEKKNK